MPGPHGLLLRRGHQWHIVLNRERCSSGFVLPQRTSPAVSRARSSGVDVCQKRCQAQGIDMPLDDGGTLQRDTGQRQRRGKRPQRVTKHGFPMGRCLTEGESNVRAFPPRRPARPARWRKFAGWGGTSFIATAVRPPISTPISMVVEQLNRLNSLRALNSFSRGVNAGPGDAEEMLNAPEIRTETRNMVVHIFFNALPHAGRVPSAPFRATIRRLGRRVQREGTGSTGITTRSQRAISRVAGRGDRG